MLKNIKASFFTRFMFEHVKENLKLKLIKYNKDIQKTIGISLVNYMRFSERYIIYETKNKGIEYDSYDNHLILEGEYLNGERNGKGKEFKKNNYYLIFEGEYRNGKRDGKGKEYDEDGSIRFEGEYLKGKRWNGKFYKFHYEDGKKLEYEMEYINGKIWKGKALDEQKNIIQEFKDGNSYLCEYDIYYGKIIFEGYYSNGERNGQGKEYDKNEYLIFEGEYINGERNGKGKEYDFNGNVIFEGEYKNGKRWNGKGYANSDKVSYEIKNGKGLIKEYNSHGSIIFEGEYLNGETKGLMKYYEYKIDDNNIPKEILIFEGESLNGKKNGKGKLYNENGIIIFEGKYLNDHKLKGKTFINGRLEFDGEYLFDKKWDGKGYDDKGNIIYELINGKGKVLEYGYLERLSFEGEYLNGERYGKGKEYDKDGKLIFEV